MTLSSAQNPQNKKAKDFKLYHNITAVCTGREILEI